MAKSVGTKEYKYVKDGHEIRIERKHMGTAYARNGNVGNPTEYFVWDFWLDGEYRGRENTRTEAYDNACARLDGRLASATAYSRRMGLWKRYYYVVTREMKETRVK